MMNPPEKIYLNCYADDREDIYEPHLFPDDEATLVIEFVPAPVWHDAKEPPKEYRVYYVYGKFGFFGFQYKRASYAAGKWTEIENIEQRGYDLNNHVLKWTYLPEPPKESETPPKQDGSWIYPKE
jgi:hypothetical protein